MAWAYRAGSFATTVSISFFGTPTLALGAAVQAGDRIVVFVFNTSGTTGTVSDNLNTGNYREDVGFTNAAGHRLAILSFANSNPGTPTITVNTGGVGTGGFCAVAYSGTSLSQPATDGTAGAGVASSTPTSGATTATTAANELVVGGYGDNGWSKTISAGSGFTLRGKFQGGGAYEGAIEDKDSGASGTSQTATFLLDSAPPNCGVVCVVYQVLPSTVSYPRTVTTTQATSCSRSLSRGYSLAVNIRQATSASSQTCGARPYANLEPLSYAQLETFTYGQLEQTCVNTYGLSRAVAQAQSVQLGRRYQLTLAAQVGQTLVLLRQSLGKTAKVFQVCSERTLKFPMCQRSAHFQAPQRGVHFTTEVR